MLRVAYLFERFPSFGQTFCYREVAELVRQGAEVSIFSIRRPIGEPEQDWNEAVVRRVEYLPDEKELLGEIAAAIRARKISAAAIATIEKWGRQSDFLRLYQAAYIGLRLRAAGIERVHAHFAGMAARTAYWIREFFGIDFSLTAHANDIFAPRDFAVNLEMLFENALAVVTVSDFGVEQLREKFPRHSAKFHRVYNGVRLADYRASSFEGGIPLLVAVGRFIEKKGFRDLIQACAILKQRSQNFRCQIIGEGPLAETLRGQIAEIELGDLVSLCNPQPQREIVNRLATTTLFVLPCRKDANGDMDNLPTVIMEAMAAGLPVVSTTLAGIPEMVAAGRTGELVRPADAAALADAIENLLRDPARIREYGTRARESAAEKFSIEKNVASLGEILRS